MNEAQEIDYAYHAGRDHQAGAGLVLAVTGLTGNDFHLLVRLKVFDTEQMNQAVFAFRRYEDASLRYTASRVTRGSRTMGSTTLWWRGSKGTGHSSHHFAEGSNQIARLYADDPPLRIVT
jgi:hypothetical protein